jgi:hypothetical protein
MTFGAVVPHLAKQGFASRQSWWGNSIIFFGIDNTSWMTTINRDRRYCWHPSMADICSKDWLKLPYFWYKPSDDYLPFDKNDRTLKKLRAIGETYSVGFKYGWGDVKKYAGRVGILPDDLIQKYENIVAKLDVDREFRIPFLKFQFKRKEKQG